MSMPNAPSVLIVDDERDVRNLVTRIFKDLDYQTDSAADGREALEKIRARRPDLVVLDLMMPEMDGWGVLQWMREEENAPPVVLLTARADYATFTRGVREGAQAFVCKPFRVQELVTTCRKLLEATQAAERPGEVAEERRRDPRRLLMVEVKVLSKDLSPLAVGEMTNLSLGGAQLDLDVPLTPGDAIRVAFNIPGGGTSMSLECRVAWWMGSADKRVSHGIAFLGLSSGDAAQLRELIGPADSH
jgi:DNA-binding response OmpR family regulator